MIDAQIQFFVFKTQGEDCLDGPDEILRDTKEAEAFVECELESNSPDLNQDKDSCNVYHQSQESCHASQDSYLSSQEAKSCSQESYRPSQDSMSDSSGIIALYII